MQNNISKLNGDRLIVKALQVRPIRTTKKIVTEMLDGSSSVQQISEQATKVDITVCVFDKSELDDICSTCETINVYHYGTTYTGIISSEAISWEPLLPGDRIYKGSFSLVVTS